MLNTMELTPGRWVRHDGHIFQVTDWHAVHGSGDVRITLVTADDLIRRVVTVAHEDVREATWELA